MRLLRIEDGGSFSLVERVGHGIPPYAILSHTWGADEEEVTFKDLVEGTGESKAGYRKIHFCAEQAAKENLQYCWVDTCCIDKSSSAELTEAINSMFRWYQNAAKCYVYMSDVPVSGSVEEEELSWKPAFKESRWFTRGWTLQELIAPATVEFFSREEQRLGNKQSLKETIYEITGIAMEALRGEALSRFSVDERISWAAKRQTRREEDAAYSLLGIFDVHMPLIYGEGQKKACERLRRKINKSLQSLGQTQKVSSLEIKLQQVLRHMQKRPKELGFPWETGVPEDWLKIDDGLGAEYFLPVELCESPEAFFSLLNHKYESKKLPGLIQLQKGHILLWEWNERHLVSRENWSNVVKGDRAVKLSFVLGNWRGPPRSRCMRCFKPRSCNTPRSSFSNCHSCKLAVRWVAPDFLPYEPDDTVIFSKDTYRDYQVKSRHPKKKYPSTTMDASHFLPPEREDGDVSPSIDLVCHRLTMKWEPIYNIVFRYIFCRCVLFLSTPSHLVKEMTLLGAIDCPRHNAEGITFRDYSELALPCHEDPYFDQFGGYNAFWALLHCYFPRIYDLLGGSKSVTDKQLDYGYVDLSHMKEIDQDAVRRIVQDYSFEVTEALVQSGMDLPPDKASDFAKEKTRRREEVKGKRHLEFDIDEGVRIAFTNGIKESFMGKELKKIKNGNWDGVPHWTIKD